MNQDGWPYSNGYWDFVERSTFDRRCVTQCDFLWHADARTRTMYKMYYFRQIRIEQLTKTFSDEEKEDIGH